VFCFCVYEVEDVALCEDVLMLPLSLAVGLCHQLCLPASGAVRSAPFYAVLYYDCYMQHGLDSVEL
jgi:hypothetical protein